jgi:hypothetical protein
VVDGVTCDDAASVAKKTKPDNQSLDIAVLQRLKLAVVLALLRTVAVCEKNHDSLDTNDDFTPLRQRSTLPLSSNCCNQRFHSQPGQQPAFGLVTSNSETNASCGLVLRNALCVSPDSRQAGN